MRDYTYNIFNNSGKDSLCEKQEYIKNRCGNLFCDTSSDNDTSIV